MKKANLKLNVRNGQIKAKVSQSCFKTKTTQKAD